jgi:hypothetical protein
MKCNYCGKRSYSEWCVSHKPRKPITKRGKRTIEYEKWRDKVAKPYLDKQYGRKCSVAGCLNIDLDVDHIITRGSRPDLKMELSNLRYLCRLHHQKRT